MDHNLFLMLPSVRAGQWYKTYNFGFGITSLSKKWAISIRETNADSQAVDASIKKWCKSLFMKFANFFMSYWNTPHTIIGETPAKIFMEKKSVQDWPLLTQMSAQP